jgi:hypothetical protein
MKKAGEQKNKTNGPTRGKRKDAKTVAGRNGESVSGPGLSRLSMVRLLIDKWSQELTDKPTKPGVAELVKLLTLEKELSASKETIREIRVTWVEPKITESSKSQ